MILLPCTGISYAAVQGNPIGLSGLGMMYLNGMGTKQVCNYVDQFVSCHNTGWW